MITLPVCGSAAVGSRLFTRSGHCLLLLPLQCPSPNFLGLMDVIGSTSIYSSRFCLCSFFSMKLLLPKSKAISYSSDLSSLGLGITWDRGKNASSRPHPSPSEFAFEQNHQGIPVHIEV